MLDFLSYNYENIDLDRQTYGQHLQIGKAQSDPTGLLFGELMLLKVKTEDTKVATGLFAAVVACFPLRRINLLEKLIP